MQIQNKRMSKLSLTLGFGMMSTMFILFNKNENSHPLRAVNTLMRKGMGHTFCLILLFLEYRYLPFPCSNKILPSPPGVFGLDFVKRFAAYVHQLNTMFVYI